MPGADPETVRPLQDWFDGVFPKDSPRNMRFSINFFTSIGLGGGCLCPCYAA